MQIASKRANTGRRTCKYWRVHAFFIFTGLKPYFNMRALIFYGEKFSQPIADNQLNMEKIIVSKFWLSLTHSVERWWNWLDESFLSFSDSSYIIDNFRSAILHLAVLEMDILLSSFFVKCFCLFFVHMIFLYKRLKIWIVTFSAIFLVVDVE